MATIESGRISTIKRVDEIISLGAQSLRETFGEKAFPYFERPSRPERLNLITSAVRDILESRLGSQSPVLDADSVYWVSKEEIAYISDYTPEPTPQFLKNALVSLGVPDKEIDPPTPADDSVSLSLWDREPVEIYLNADKCGTHDLATFTGQTAFDFEIAYQLIWHSIYSSRIPLPCLDNEALAEVIKANLERDKKEYPRKCPSIDRVGLINLVDALKMMVDEDSTRHFVLNGTEIRCRHSVGEKRKDQYGEPAETIRHEDFAATGQIFGDTVTRYIAEKVTREFLKGWASTTYPQDREFQEGLATRYGKLNTIATRHKRDFTELEAFFGALGIVGYRKIFAAYHQSIIPLEFLEAKKKHKKLYYPR